ncbi:MAG: pyruvate kinase [Spirochaetaceae bacterium]|nr:pyruvate kinase [Spirochaetaceae bacterium]MCF7947242.1 pyruvate kinase [Spirochaetia bacterium]MCF7950281.1 pyruvate kinase [Spirochaetaceae bacterium]
MTQLRKTRIVATLGPSSDEVPAIKKLLAAGVNVARFNFSHGDHEEQAGRLKRIRQASAETGIPVALMLDTKGPEIRTGKVKDDGEIELHKDDEIVLTTEQIEGDRHRLSISYSELPQDVDKGTHIFIADGVIDLEVLKVDGTEVYCRVQNGGLFGSRKNVNIPGVKVSLPAITEKDRQDILFAIRHEMDFIAASFIRTPQEVEGIREIIKEHNSPIHIISKIENQQGLDNIDDIIRVSNGIMIARGDLGVQLSVEQIPLAQKRIIEKCIQQNKPVITATQMLDSMIHNPNPTRAELTDVANAIFDGADAVMLSGETANGKHPLRSVETMNRIALAVEQSPEYLQRNRRFFDPNKTSSDIGHAIAKAAYIVAQEIEASAIVTPTLRGNSPRILSNYRPEQNIIAVTTSQVAYRQMMLNWGIFPICTEMVQDSEMMLQNALRLAMQHGFIKKPERVVTAAGIPLNSPIPMNTIKVHFLGSILNRGHRGFGGVCSGTVVKAGTLAQAKSRLKRDGTEILLTRFLSQDFLELLPEVRGIIIEEDSAIPPDEIFAANPELVFIADVPEALSQFEDYQLVTLDGGEKIIYEGFLDNISE